MRKRVVFILALFICLSLFVPDSALATSCDYTVNDVAGVLNAKSEIRDANNSMTNDIVVCLRGGRYLLSDTLEFTPQDSGTNGHNIIYAAYSGERPRISGGQQIRSWRNSSEPIEAL